jgi:hypothetical protein
MTPLERETKLTVSPDDYRRILDGSRVLEVRDQLNVYLHDPGRLGEELGYFRVRFERGREAVATLKIPSGWHGDTREMMEVEHPLRELGPALYPWPRRWVAVDTGVPEGLMEHFQALGITRLRRLGWMRNLRYVVELGPARVEELGSAGAVELELVGTVELDRTVLPGGAILYEVEIESARDETHRLLADRIRKLAPSAEISRIGKFDRFLAALGHPSYPPV